MKNKVLSLLISVCLLFVCVGCMTVGEDSVKSHEHELDEYFGVIVEYIEDGPTTYYYCPECDKVFTKDYEEVESFDNSYSFFEWDESSPFFNQNLLFCTIDDKDEDEKDIRERILNDISEGLISCEELEDEFYDYYSTNGYYLLLSNIYRLYACMFFDEETEYCNPEYMKISDECYEKYLYGLDNVSMFFDLCAEKEQYRSLAENKEDNRGTNGRITELKSELNRIASDCYNEEKLEEYVASFKELSSELALLNGYEDYFDYYSSEKTHHSFSYKDLGEVNDYFMKYIVDIFIRNRANMFAMEEALSKDEELDYKQRNLRGAFHQNEYLEDYFSNSTVLKNAWESLNDSDYILISDKDSPYINSSLNVLFGMPFMFLKKNAKSSFTFLHEFGHYSAYKSGHMYGSEDWEETQSTCGPALYSVYCYNTQNDAAGTLTLLEQLDFLLIGMISPLTQHEMEVYIMENDNLSLNDIDNHFIEFSASLGCDRSNHSTSELHEVWVSSVFMYPTNSISYVFSGLASLKLMTIAFEDYDAACEIYREILNHGDSDFGGLVNAYEALGLGNPFTEEFYENLADSLNELLAEVTIM